jgi:hypothetical protein
VCPGLSWASINSCHAPFKQVFYCKNKLFTDQKETQNDMQMVEFLTENVKKNLMLIIQTGIADSQQVACWLTGSKPLKKMFGKRLAVCL